MKVNRDENLIQFGEKTEQLDEVVNHLAIKDSGTSARYLAENTTLPRKLRTEALRLVLNDYVKIAKDLVLSDEVMYRLNWYPKFSETQLVLFWRQLASNNRDRFNEKKEIMRFKRTFYTLLLMNAEAVGFSDEELQHMFMFHEDPSETIDEFMDESDKAFYDFDYNLDGVAFEDVHTVLKKGSTVSDIRKLAKKYDIDVPKRLKKEEFVNLVCDGLRRQGKYSPETEEELRKMNAISLTRYAKVNNIKASTEMKKDDVIDYLMNHLESSSNVTKPRIEIQTLPELEEFKFSSNMLRLVKFHDDEDDEETVEEAPQMEEVKPVEAPQKEEPKPVEEPKMEEPQPVEEEKEDEDQELVEKLNKILNEKDQDADTREDLKRYNELVGVLNERLKGLEETIADMKNNPTPVEVTVNFPQPEEENEVVEEEEQQTPLQPFSYDAEFSHMSEEEKQEVAKQMMKGLKKETEVDGVSTEGMSRKEIKKMRKQLKREKNIKKAREYNDLALSKRQRRRKFWRVVKTIILVLVLLFIALTTWSILFDKNVIPHNSVTETIDKIIGYTYIFRGDSSMRQWMLKSTNDIIGLFQGGNK